MRYEKLDGLHGLVLPEWSTKGNRPGLVTQCADTLEARTTFALEMHPAIGLSGFGGLRDGSSHVEVPGGQSKGAYQMPGYVARRAGNQ